MGKAILVLTFLARSAIGLVCRRGARLTYPDRLTPLSPTIFLLLELYSMKISGDINNINPYSYWAPGAFASIALPAALPTSHLHYFGFIIVDSR